MFLPFEPASEFEMQEIMVSRQSQIKAYENEWARDKFIPNI